MIPIGAPQLHIGLPCIPRHVLHVPTDRIQLRALLVHNMRHVAEQLVQLADTGLDIPDLSLSLDDQRFLKIDLVLRSEVELFLLLLLELLLLLWVVGISRQTRGVIGVYGCSGLVGGSSLLLKSSPLDRLKFCA